MALRRFVTTAVDVGVAPPLHLSAVRADLLYVYLPTARTSLLKKCKKKKKRGGSASEQTPVSPMFLFSIDWALLVGSAIALVTFICVFFCLAPQVVRVLL
jgi:low affinity Fe/Cu permease